MRRHAAILLVASSRPTQGLAAGEGAGMQESDRLVEDLGLRQYSVLAAQQTTPGQDSRPAHFPPAR
jgi:hypothetical protein